MRPEVSRRKVFPPTSKHLLARLSYSTAALICSIALLLNSQKDVYKRQDADILNYRKGLSSFYENETYSLYTDYFLDRQLVRIKAVSYTHLDVYKRQHRICIVQMIVAASLQAPPA